VTWRTGSILVVLLSLIVWGLLLRREQTELDRRAQRVVLPKIDYSLRNLQMHQLGADGQLVGELEAEAMAHLRVSDSAILQKPVIHAVDDKAVPLRISADTASLARQEEKLIFSGHVLMLHGFPQDIPAEMTTEQLDVYPRKRLANTDLDVTLRQGGSILTGTGLEADLEHGQINILANVRGSLQPIPRQPTAIRPEDGSRSSHSN
jgi:LPS export ABC transporter protein LptC